MTSIFTKLIYLLILLASLQCFSKELTLVTGFSKPPYSLMNENAGFELEIIQTVFEELDYDIRFVTAPFGRNQRMFKVDGVDGLTTANKKLYSKSEHLTEPYIIYRNVVITLKKSNIKITSITDLANYKLAAFQNSKTILGPLYAHTVSKSLKFLELSEQSNQLKMLETGAVDGVIMDINIFKYFNQNHNLDVDVHALFEPSIYGLLLKDKTLVPEVNRVLRNFLASKKYPLMAEKWGIEESLLLKEWHRSP